MFVQATHNASDLASLISTLLEVDPFAVVVALDDHATLATTKLTTWYCGGQLPTPSYAVVSPRGVAISRFMPSLEAEALGEMLSRAGALERAPRIQGPLAASLAFARGYCQHHRNTEFRPTATVLMYILDTPPRIPQSAGGNLRAANSMLDFEVLVEWCSHASQLLGGSLEDVEAYVTRGLDRKSLFLWEVNGYPVGFTAHSLPIEAGGPGQLVIKVNHVYVPPSVQGQGYGTAMLAALCHYLQAENKAGSCRILVSLDQGSVAATKVLENVGFSLQNHTTITADLVVST